MLSDPWRVTGLRAGASRMRPTVYRIELTTLAAHVSRIMAAPRSTVPTTGDPALDESLADLAHHRASAHHRPEAPPLAAAPFWLTPPPSTPCAR